jgi:hypothetical protein
MVSDCKSDTTPQQRHNNATTTPQRYNNATTTPQRRNNAETQQLTQLKSAPFPFINT